MKFRPFALAALVSFAFETISGAMMLSAE